jgi:hypothetical protein
LNKKTLDTSYQSIYLGIPSDKNPKGQKHIFGDFMIPHPTIGTSFVSPWQRDLLAKSAAI